MELNQYLVLMLERKAQSLHLVAGSPPLFRSPQGVMSPLTNDPLNPAEIKSLIENSLSADQKMTLAKEKELSATYSVEGVSRFRCHVFYQRGTLAAVFRTSPPQPASLGDLGIPDFIKDLIMKPHGLVLIVGPRGSGKSHTLAALTDFLLETKPYHIVSIENPIEFLFRNKKGVIYQREVGSDTVSYKSGLSSATRQNPDVLVVTELPDMETIAAVLSAAATGQMVLASVTANGVVMAIEQLIEVFPPHHQQQVRSQLGMGLEVMLGHTLVAKQGGGSALVLEVLIGTPAVRALIREGKLAQLLQAMNSGRDAGMQSQEVALKTMVKKNLVTQEEAVAKAVRPEELKRLLAMPF